MTPQSKSVDFDASLPLLCEALLTSQVASVDLESVVVVRDPTGRLAVFIEQELAPETLEKIGIALRNRLGAYARPDRPVADGSLVGAESIFSEARSNGKAYPRRSGTPKCGDSGFGVA